MGRNKGGMKRQPLKTDQKRMGSGIRTDKMGGRKRGTALTKKWEAPIIETEKEKGCLL